MFVRVMFTWLSLAQWKVRAPNGWQGSPWATRPELHHGSVDSLLQYMDALEGNHEHEQRSEHQIEPQSILATDVE